MTSRRRALWIAACLTAIACSSAPRVGAYEQPADGAPPGSWELVMHEVDEQHKVLLKLLERQPIGDLDAVASAAERAAYLVRFGYGHFEQERVPNFASMARECESWLLHIALESRQGHAELARSALRAGKSHCKKCHDAAEKIQW